MAAAVSISKTKKPGNYRWTVCALLFWATTINYLDRQVIALLKPYLSDAFKWNSGDYANIEIAFKIFYALGMLVAGRVIDSIGTKKGYGLFAGIWSFAAAAHAFVNSTAGFIAVRSFLGIAEAGNFPAAVKTTAEWFPKKERALATGIFNSGANAGAIIAPLSVPFIAETFSWQTAFLITGAVGFMWLAAWLVFYNKPADAAKLSKAEFDYINSDAGNGLMVTGEPGEPASWRKLLALTQTRGYLAGKFLTDPIWWFYLFWLPDFLNRQYGLSPAKLAVPVALVYTMSTIGSIAGGWLPLVFIRKGFTVLTARKTSMLFYALLVVPIVFAQYLGTFSMWFTVMIIGLAAAAHQAWSANLYTIASDVFPTSSVASVTGLGGLAGSIGGILLSLLVQKHLFIYYESINRLPRAYFIMFLICAFAYLCAWLIMFVLSTPKRITVITHL